MSNVVVTESPEARFKRLAIKGDEDVRWLVHEYMMERQARKNAQAEVMAANADLLHMERDKLIADEAIRVLQERVMELEGKG